jgi:hypothetical protein
MVVAHEDRNQFMPFRFSLIKENTNFTTQRKQFAQAGPSTGFPASLKV